MLFRSERFRYEFYIQNVSAISAKSIVLRDTLPSNFNADGDLIAAISIKLNGTTITGGILTANIYTGNLLEIVLKTSIEIPPSQILSIAIQGKMVKG